MNLQVEDLGHSKAKLTVTVPPEDVEKALQKAYLVQRGSLDVPGFRKGKAPRDVIERMYGPQVFYNEAADKMIQESYGNVFRDKGLDIVSPPKFSVVQFAKDKDFIYTAEVILRPEVTLGEYKALTVDKFSTDVTFMEVNEQIEQERSKNAREIDIKDRGVQNKDNITLDFEGFVDGKPFEGGKATDYKLTVGAGAFMPGFEEQLIGAVAGEKREVRVTFPAEYPQRSLAGKEASFQCTVKSIKIKELPELDDEFASEVSSFETFDEYRADVEKRLKQDKERNGKQNQKVQAVAKAVANATVDVPDEMVLMQVRQMEDDFTRSLMRQGISIDDYLKETGLTLEKMGEELKPEAKRYLETRLVLEAIAKAENIVVSDDRLNEQLVMMASASRVNVEDVKSYLGEEQMKHMKTDMAVQDAIKLVAETAVEA